MRGNRFRMFWPEDYPQSGDDADRRSIQKAIRAAYDEGGGTVVLAPRVYEVSFAVQIDPGVSLIGSGQGNTTIRLKRQTAVFPATSLQLDRLCEAYEDINWAVVAFRNSPAACLAELDIDANAPAHEPKFGCCGIYIQDSAHAHLDRVNVVNAKRCPPDPETRSFGFGGDGVWVRGGTPWPPPVRSEPPPNPMRARLPDASEGVTIFRCRLERNNNHGIAVTGAARNLRILHCTANENEGSGIDFEMYTKPEPTVNAYFSIVQGNYVCGNSHSGIVLGTPGAERITIANNTISNNGQWGISIAEGGTDAVVIGNVATGNGSALPPERRADIRLEGIPQPSVNPSVEIAGNMGTYKYEPREPRPGLTKRPRAKRR